MYLKQIFIENSGPLRRLDLDLDFTDNGLPKPIVLVGSNGGGKTNLLSHIADALFEAATEYYDNLLPTKGTGRAWFRIVGGSTMTVGATGGFSLLRFEHKGRNLIYQEKVGNVDSDAAQRIPENLRGQMNWPQEGAFKKFFITEEASKAIFKEEVHVYFPSSRSEIPFWLNQESVPTTEFDFFTVLNKKLHKPIYVERSLQAFKQWLASVILDSRAHIAVSTDSQVAFQGNIVETIESIKLFDVLNTILRMILDDEDVYFVWLGRKSPDKLAVARGKNLILPNLNALSGGQSILLGLFGTLLRYADNSITGSALNLSDVEGICIVDEIDSHIHVDLQHKILPQLIALFPRIQFIVSSHSPLFVLGMEKTFGGDGFQLIEMPDGKIVTSETYSEFGKAMEALTATETFNAEILSNTSQSGIPIVFVEGETDAPYLRRAAEVLGRGNLLQRCEIQWIGAKDEEGQGFHTGKKALDHTLAVIRANPKLINRRIMLLYDNDAQNVDEDYGMVSVRRMPTNEANTRISVGIENLLSQASITDQDYQSKETVKPKGDLITHKSLRKQELCNRMCQSGTVKDFEAFTKVLDVIDNYLKSLEATHPSVHNESVIVG